MDRRTTNQPVLLDMRPRLISETLSTPGEDRSSTTRDDSDYWIPSAPLVGWAERHGS